MAKLESTPLPPVTCTFVVFRVVLPSKPVHEVFAVESSANLWHKRRSRQCGRSRKLSKSLSVKPTHFEVVDSHKYSYVELLVRKSDASLAIRNFIARCESYFSGDSAGDRVAYFHSDNGGEYISKDLEQFFVSKGIKHTYTVPHTPQQNGVAERLNRTLFEKAKSMLLYAHAPEYLWGEAVKSANYIRNRLPSRTTGGVAPLQLWTGKPPSYHHMKFPFMKSDKDLSINGTGVGFSVGSGSGSMSGPCFDSKGTVLGLIDLPASSSGSGSGSICANTVSNLRLLLPSHSPSPPLLLLLLIIVHKPRSVRRILSTPSAPLVSYSSYSSFYCFSSISSSSPILPPSDHDVSISPDSSPIISSSEYIPSQLDLSELLVLVLSLRMILKLFCPKSRSRVVAVRLPSITPAKRPSSDDIVSPPSKHLCENSLKQSPMFCNTCKTSAEEECISYRRLKSLRFEYDDCVLDFQVEGIDYTETLLVVRYETVRIVLYIAAQFGFQVHHMDVETAFLNVDLKEDIYMRQPKGFVVKGQNLKCHLKKSLWFKASSFVLE
ncbi:uncharacterized protein SAPINGB_P002467 [Magnusiomyces paraingens]|uniref:Integrase catalytic domain-containing protein n=1 Tax=Magnusiomyces paraingens TaxID=2606893 RepID=A0A5E8BE29_9ASCO|nr:uncharacterized protein SAPINGB_P002467 [Saprochaete ingens]VVT49835.1 unnamed protein product [Saprochaete ingens]